MDKLHMMIINMEEFHLMELLRMKQKLIQVLVMVVVLLKKILIVMVKTIIQINMEEVMMLINLSLVQKNPLEWIIQQKILLVNMIKMIQMQIQVLIKEYLIKKLIMIFNLMMMLVSFQKNKDLLNKHLINQLKQMHIHINLKQNKMMKMKKK